MDSLSFTTHANPQQQQAIHATEGPILIIAGPGSGKTFTLVERIVYLILEKQVTPDQFLVVTFTDKAARELTTRIATRLNQLNIRFNLNEMYLGTFHSICLRWLDEYREYTRLKRNFLLFDQFDQQFFLYRRLNEYLALPGIEHLCDPAASRWHQTGDLLRWLNTVSEEALSALQLIVAPHPDVQALGHAYALYQQHLQDENALDFSTIQAEAYTLLTTQPLVAQRFQEQIRYIMVDEYQDTNTIQDLILSTLTKVHQNICVVGDDDQGLYRFRGATIRNILQFADKFAPGQCQHIHLTVNYRSHPAIIDLYNQWMGDQSWTVGSQTFRFPKQITARPDYFPMVPTVLRVGAAPDDWNDEVLAFLHALRDAGTLTNWNQVAFLFRSVKHPTVVSLAQYLETHGIAVYSPRSNQFFDREEIRLMIGALIFLFPDFPNQRMWAADAHLGIWEYYDQACFAVFAQELRKPENDDLLAWARTMALRHRALAQNADYAFTGMFYQLLQFPLFSRYLDEQFLKDGVAQSRAMRNLATFSQLLGKFEYLHHISVLNPEFLTKNLRDLFNQFLRFLKDGGIDEYEDEAEYAPSGCVSFLTIHQAKGLEFPVVIVDSLNSVPRKQYSDLDEVLATSYLARPPFEPFDQMKFYDFRRLYYTAFSRAQNLLVLAYPQKQGQGTSPSKYFAPYVQTLPSWRDPAVQLSAVPLVPVKDVDIKREYSFTGHLTLYEHCAEQYRFFKELGFAPIRTSPILFGTLVHQTIEDIHKAVLRGDEHRLSDAQVTNWFDTNYAYLTKRERVYLAPIVKLIALDQVLRYFQSQQGHWSRIQDTEVDVSLVKDAYILAGSVDLIRGEGQTVEIIDFKTEKKLDVNDPKDRDKLNRYRRQLEVYAHIIEERTGHPVSKMHLYYTSEEAGNPYITFPTDHRLIDQTIMTFDAVVQRIEVKDFSISERPTRICRDCDMRAYCDRKNWTFRK